MSKENDHRLAVLNSFLGTPHRELTKNYEIHRSLVNEDPEFYGKLAYWYSREGSVRDHQDLFVATLVGAKEAELRSAGLFLLRNLPPYRVQRVVEFFKKNVKKALPRSLKRELASYLWERECNRNQFDRAILTGSRKALKYLYAIAQIPRSDYAGQVLFEKKPPEGSVHAALKQAAKETDPTQQARILLGHKIPFRIVSSVLKKMTPAGLVALIEGMSPQELINNLESLTERGALNNPDLKKLVDKKLEAAKTDRRVAQSALKSEKAFKSANLDQDVIEKLQDIADTQMKAKGRIKRSTALMVDKSSSLLMAIEVAKELGVTVSALMEKNVPLHVIAFDGVARTIEVKGTARKDWQEAFRGITAQGSTSIGSGVARLIRDNLVVENLVIVTDEGENATPYFVDEYKKYVKAFQAQFAVLGSDPHVTIVHVGQPSNYLANKCKEAGISHDVITVGLKQENEKSKVKKTTSDESVDYYAIPNIVPFLTRRTRLDLLMDILDLKLPDRQEQVGMPDIVAQRTI